MGRTYRVNLCLQGRLYSDHQAPVGNKVSPRHVPIPATEQDGVARANHTDSHQANGKPD